MSFRRDINGLRAIAVIAVVLFHFNPQLISGGFVGVDVFFVISGFLMTKIIMTAIEAQRFSLRSFYQARIKRIVPALTIMCAVLMLFGFWQLNSASFVVLTEHILSSLLFVSNISYMFESGYFDAVASEKWLLHTWSLSLEWQFYLVYPLLVLLCLRFMPLLWFKRLMLATTLLGVAASAAMSFIWQEASYYLLVTRAWQLQMGALAFLYPVNIIQQRLYVVLGLAGIIVSCLIFSEHTVWPGFWAVLPVLSTYLVIVAKADDFKLFSYRWLSLIGRWSYSIYLWHWPLVVAGFYYQLPYWFVIGPVISVVLGALSYYWVEQKNRPTFYSLTFILVLALAVGMVVNKAQTSGKAQVAHLKTQSSICQDLTSVCQAYGNGHAPDFIVWGDSHAVALARALALEGYNLVVFATLGCPPIDKVRRADGMGGDSGCHTKVNDRIFQRLMGAELTNRLIMIGRWSVYHHGWMKKGQLQRANHYLCFDQCSEIESKHSLANWHHGLEQTIAALSNKYQLVLFKGGPNLKVRGVDYRGLDWQHLSLSEHLSYQAATDQVIEQLSEQYDFAAIEHGAMWFSDGKMQMYHEDKLLFNDDNHPTIAAWQVIFPQLIPQLNQALELR